jgi:hypothetical protein
MLGEPTIGTYVAYGLIAFFLLLLVVLFLRTAAILALLWLEPLAKLAPSRRRSSGGDGSELPPGGESA